MILTPGKEPSPKLLPFSQNSIDFKNVETILSNSNVPISAGAERALHFLKQSGQKSSQTNPPNMEMLMNLINQTNLNHVAPQLESSETKSNENVITPSVSNEKISETSKATEILMIKSYLDVRLKEMQETIMRDFAEKLKGFEERQNQKFDKILSVLIKK